MTMFCQKYLKRIYLILCNSIRFKIQYFADKRRCGFSIETDNPRIHDQCEPGAPTPNGRAPMILLSPKR